jgi:hypothetical protein
MTSGPGEELALIVAAFAVSAADAADVDDATTHPAAAAAPRAAAL